VPEVIAVRGDHLVLFRSRVEFDEGTATESLVVVADDADMRLRHAVMFDPDDRDDRDRSLAELDRLHTELDADADAHR
jgi:hypothetical protein